jgi:RNA polymerase sigma factor (sigma-70 family)
LVDYEQLFLGHLKLIDRVVRHIARRHHLPVLETDEFASVVRLKLVDNDYAILRKFQRRSNLSTYLTTVVERLYLDFCIARWGKWRPSAAARRLGRDAVMLEQLLARDGLSFEEAVETLHTNHGCSATREQLRALSVQFPERVVRRHGGEDEVALAARRLAATDTIVDHEEDREIAEKVESVLAEAVAALTPRERLILKLRFDNDMKISDIARLVQTPAKPLYRELQNIVGGLQERLREEGLERGDIERIVGNPAVTLGGILIVGEPQDESV